MMVPSLVLIQAALFAVLLIIASIQDIRTREIPNWISGALLAIGLLQFHGLIAVIGLITTSLPYLLTAILSNGRIGGGDIKLMAACGFIFGTAGGMIQSIVGLTLVLLFTVWLALRKGYQKAKQTPLPLAPFLSVGGLFSFAWLHL